MSRAADAVKPSKFCASCGRVFHYRASLARDWSAAKFCSASCRSSRASHHPVDRGIEGSFLSVLLANLHNPDVSRRRVTCEQVQAADGPEREKLEWRERYRRAARRLANVKEVCYIERIDDGSASGGIGGSRDKVKGKTKGKAKDKERWIPGDGKGPMRVWLRDDKVEEAKRMNEELQPLREKALLAEHDQEAESEGDAAGRESDADEQAKQVEGEAASSQERL